MAVIRKAVKSRPNLRVGFSGPSKSGKTGSMLVIATGHNPWTDETDVAPLVEGRIGVIDAEDNGGGEGTSELYADLFDFDIIVLKRTHADYYTEAIQEFAVKGQQVVKGLGECEPAEKEQMDAVDEELGALLHMRRIS